MSQGFVWYFNVHDKIGTNKSCLVEINGPKITIKGTTAFRYNDFDYIQFYIFSLNGEEMRM